MITPLFLHLEIAGICSEAVLLYFFHHQCQQIRVWLQVYNMNLHWTAWNYVTQSRCLDRNNQWTTKLCHFYTYVCASVFSIHITDKHTYILIVTFLNIDDHFDLLRYIYIFAGIGTQILFWNIAISRRRRRYCFSPFFHPAVLAAGTETSWKEITRRTWFHETRRRTWMICNRNRNIEIQIESVPAETEITLYSDGLGFLYPCDRWPFLDLRLRAGWLSLSHCMHWMIRLPSICAGSSWTTNSPKNHGQWSTFFFGKKSICNCREMNPIYTGPFAARCGLRWLAPSAPHAKVRLPCFSLRFSRWQVACSNHIFPILGTKPGSRRFRSKFCCDSCDIQLFHLGHLKQPWNLSRHHPCSCQLPCYIENQTLPRMPGPNELSTCATTSQRRVSIRFRWKIPVGSNDLMLVIRGLYL